MAAYPIVKIQTSFVQAQPSTISVLSNEASKADIVSCLEIRTQPNEPLSSVEFVFTQLPEFAHKEKQPNMTMLLLNGPPITASAEHSIGADVIGASNEPAETCLVLMIEQTTLGTIDASENGLTLVRPETCQTNATLDYAVNSESPTLRLWGDTESYGHIFLQPQTSTTPNSIWSSTFLRNLAEKNNSVIEPASNEPVTFDNTIIQIFCLPHSHLATLQEPVYFYMVLLGFAANNNHPGAHTIFLATVAPPTLEMK